MGVFEKAAIFTDIHFGLRNDSEQHNQDCLEFVEWFADQAVQNTCDTVIFMGDWFHNRVRTEVRTAYYSKKAIEILGNLPMNVWWLLGNHDIYMKNDREIHSLMYLNNYKNIKLIEKVTQIEDVVFSPWLVGDDQSILLSTRGKYIFGHFELPFFLMNQVIEKIYDGEGLHIDDFQGCDAVYSGHFHKRQVRLNKHKIPIHYIGNPFGHDFNDCNDHERGMAILQYGETIPEYISWPLAPTFDRYDMSEVVEMMEETKPINTRSTIEIVDDLDLPADISNELRETIEARNVKIRRPKKAVVAEDKSSDVVKFNSLDEMIESKLKSMIYDGNYDPQLLIDLYRLI